MLLPAAAVDQLCLFLKGSLGGMAKVYMELTEWNLDDFLASIKKRLTEELKTGAPVKLYTRDHYPEPRTVEIEGKVYPYPAVGESIIIQVGFRPEEM